MNKQPGNSETNESKCLELVEAATEFAEASQLDLAAETFLEAAECFDQEGDRSRSARYLTAAAEFFEMLGNQRRSSRCYGKAILRHLLADEVENAIVVLQKAHLLGATSSMFNFLLARKNFEQRGINVDQILERAEKDLSTSKIEEIKSRIMLSKSKITPIAQKTLQESTQQLPETIHEFEQKMPEFKLVPLQEPESIELFSLNGVTMQVEPKPSSETPAHVLDAEKEPFKPLLVHLKSFEIHPRDEETQELITKDEDFELSLLSSLEFDKILELKPVEITPQVKIDVTLPDISTTPSLEMLDEQNEKFTSTGKKHPITFSINQKLEEIQQATTNLWTNLSDLEHIEGASLQARETPASLAPTTQESLTEAPPESISVESVEMTPSSSELNIPNLEMRTEPIRYINIHEIVPETSEIISIPELVITTTISPQWEVLDAQMSGSMNNAEMTGREITDKGEIITWKIKEVKSKNPIKIQYTLRRRFQRILYWRVGNKVHTVTVYQPILKNDEKWHVDLSFVNTQSKTIHEILIEDVPPPELLVEHIESTINQDPKIILKEGLTRFQWYQQRLELGEKIDITYLLAERPLSYHFIDDFIERFTGQRIRVEKIVEPRTMGKDLHFFVLYRVISSTEASTEIKLTDNYPSEFSLENYKPEWEKIKYEEIRNQKMLEWTVNNDVKGIKTLLLVMKGSQNYSPTSPTIDFKSKKILESKEIERKIIKKIINLKTMFMFPD